jgi:hypothetical protein
LGNRLYSVVHNIYNKGDVLMENLNEAIEKVSDIYSIFTNNGYVADSSSVLGVKVDSSGMPKRALIQDLLTLPDMTRF